MLPICPECAAGKHQNCDGTGDYDNNDNRIPCGCNDDSHKVYDLISEE